MTDLSIAELYYEVTGEASASLGFDVVRWDKGEATQCWSQDCYGWPNKESATELGLCERCTKEVIG
jgi:hypothetical protein